MLFQLSTNHQFIRQVLHEIVNVEMSINKSLPYTSLVYWIRMYLHDIKNMTRTLAEIIHSLNPEYGIKTKQRLKNRTNEDGWIWAP